MRFCSVTRMSNKQVWKVICFSILFVSVNAFHVAAQAQPKPDLILNVTGQPPLNTAAHDGFMDVIAREAIRRIGYNMVINRLPAERGLRSADKGLIDGEMSRVKGIEKNYVNLIRVPEKIMNWEFCVFSKKPIDLSQGWASLAKQNVAFVRGWKILEKNVPSSAEITKVANSKLLFTLLKKDRVDYVLYERWGGASVKHEMGIGGVQLRMPVLASKEMFIYLHKKHQALVPRLSQALADMKKDGAYDALVEKHLTPILVLR